jgi:hypothetical protein
VILSINSGDEFLDVVSYMSNLKRCTGWPDKSGDGVKRGRGVGVIGFNAPCVY